MVIGIIILGVIVYANPQLWEDVKKEIAKKSQEVVTISQQLTKNNISTTPSYNSIKDISQNPTDYLGQHIIVRGTLQSRFFDPSIVDKDDYWIWLDGDTCEERQRDYDYGSTYIAEGTFSTINHIYSTYGIVCSKPIH